MLDYTLIKEELNQRMEPKLYIHSLSAAQTAKELAAHYEFDEEQAYCAALLHDYAKAIKNEDLLQIAWENDLLSNTVENEMPHLLHAPVGAYLAQLHYNVDNPEILQAISYHTLGGLDMSILSKIVYLADKIEPGRRHPESRQLREISYKGLDEAMLYSLESTIINCIVKKSIIHPRTIIVYNHFLRIIRNK
ncbi:MAG: bis(5'-nucleosyl)-tetraphosphatase (symmetrical) YqeK [Syntrophomonadaceae bacterium]|jgi:predicted HD superfamily hydrolase involved in NAD metabolism|nr:bis(5'-nucleosyl)-tetraphosphatase (symmetrical) YqeK [Syntrophomonadaceae bacterium]